MIISFFSFPIVRGDARLLTTNEAGQALGIGGRKGSSKPSSERREAEPYRGNGKPSQFLYSCTVLVLIEIAIGLDHSCVARGSTFPLCWIIGGWWAETFVIGNTRWYSICRSDHDPREEDFGTSTCTSSGVFHPQHDSA